MSLIVPVDLRRRVESPSSSDATVGSMRGDLPVGAPPARACSPWSGWRRCSVKTPVQRCRPQDRARARASSFGVQEISSLKKKNALPRPSNSPGMTIGPPTLAAERVDGRSRPRQPVQPVEERVRVQRLVLEVLVRRAADTCSCPTWSRTAPASRRAPEPSAPAVAVVSVTSSTASRRGVTIVKKPSPDCRLLLVLTPSMVMLIVFCGRPLIVEPARVARPGVSTPGRNTRKSSALRLSARHALDELGADRRADGRRLDPDEVGRRRHRDHLGQTADLQRRRNRRGLAREKAHVGVRDLLEARHLDGDRVGADVHGRKRVQPLSVRHRGLGDPRCSFVTVTVAPGITPPSVSFTIPESEVVDAAPCANATDDDSSTLVRYTAASTKPFFIGLLPHLWPPGRRVIRAS